MFWKAADMLNPPPIDICQYGWEVKEQGPLPTTGVTHAAPPQIMKVIACNCSAQPACSRATCSCRAAAISCTSFCKCHQAQCANPFTKVDNGSDNEDDENDN